MSVLVGRMAPDFTAPAVLGNGEIVGDYSFLDRTKGKYRVLFFYPLDFTFVCPSELIAFDHRNAEFEKRMCRSSDVPSTRITRTTRGETPMSKTVALAK
ncbi:MAG: redoxin domain-containing protein [Polyangiales bacterium]